MGLLVLFIMVILSLFGALALCIDHRRPWTKRLRYKYRVKDDSIFRKIIKFKDEDDCIYNYFKIVPFYVYLLLAILSLILLLVDIFANGIITSVISKEVFIKIGLFILTVEILYTLIIVIWWDIDDYKDVESNKEAKNLKQLRKLLKENKKNKK